MFPLSRPSSAQPFRTFPFDERSESPASVIRKVPIKVHSLNKYSHSTPSETDSDSSGTLRYDSRRPSNLYSDRDRDSTLAPSLSRRSTPSPQPVYQNPRAETPTNNSNFTTTNNHRLPSYYPQRHRPLTSNSSNTSFDSLPPRNDRIYERQHTFTPKPRPYQSSSTLRLSMPSNENNMPSLLRRTQTQNDVLSEENMQNQTSTSPSSLTNRRESDPVVLMKNETDISLPPRPNSRLSTKSRSKSPSLSSLRQGLKKANFIPQCLTKQSKPKELEVNVDNRDSVYKPSSTDENNVKKNSLSSPNKTKSSFLSFWQKPSRTQSTPSLVDPKPLSLRRPSENDLDPVEEAIKSLENFDPNEFIKPTSNSPAEAIKPTKNLANRSQSVEKLTPLRSYASINLPYTASLPPIPKVDYNTDSEVPKMGNHGSVSNKSKSISSNANQREPQVTFQLPPNNPRIENDSRRKIQRQQMTDNAKSIELHAVNLGRIISNPNWRHSKELQHSLPYIREIVYGVDNGLNDLIDSSARINLQRADPAYHELQLLLNPLRTSHSLIKRLRMTLNSTNWSVQLLARQSNSSENANDSLDQFVAILRHLPNDCSKLVHWVYNQDRINMVSFLPAGVSTAAPPPSINQQSPNYQSRHQVDSNRVDFGGLRRDKPLINPKNTPYWHGEIVDGGESTTSSNDSSPITRSIDDDDLTTKHSSGANSNQRQHDEESIADDVIMEEDDLASVISEQQSPTWTSAPEFPSTKLRQDSGDKHRRQLHIEMVKDMKEEEKEFIQFCSPQINQHVDTLTQVIEQFFNTIETGQHPNKFSQKLRLISIQTMGLVGLTSNIGKHMSQPILRAEFKHAADSLDSLALECEHKLKVAEKQHPSVNAIQSLVSAVVALSKQAQNLKLITRTCQLAAAK